MKPQRRRSVFVLEGIETNSGPLIPFLEGTDVFLAPGEDTVFEANIFPHLVLAQNFTDIIDIAAQLKRTSPSQ